MQNDCHVYHGNNTTYCHDNSIDILVYTSMIQVSHPEEGWYNNAVFQQFHVLLC